MNFKLPGGKFNDEDESPIEAAERELREELGIVNVIDLKFAIELKTDDQLSRRFIYYCFIDNSKIKQTSEIHSIFWASEETLPECKNRKHMLSAVEAVYDVIKKQ
jgi:8-oxo-dGTP pyrophosphatase MutT (NUDIX family)